MQREIDGQAIGGIASKKPASGCNVRRDSKPFNSRELRELLGELIHSPQITKPMCLYIFLT